MFGTVKGSVDRMLASAFVRGGHKARNLKTKEELKLAAKERKKAYKHSIEDFKHYEHADISDYYFENGLRKVYPYMFEFKAYAKRRWIGRPISEVLESEFTFPYPEMIQEKCNSDSLRVNGNKISPDYVIRDSDFISHRVHRHELPVIDCDIPFVYEDHDVLVLNKPASIPIHPCGPYTLNSITHILGREYERRPLRFVHRLDRMTSGLMIAAKNYDASFRIASQISAREVKKFYVALIDGQFPTTQPNIETSTSGQSSLNSIGNNVIVCDRPIGALCARMGLHAILPENEGGKAALTHFLRLTYDPVQQKSLVLCKLFTGRTHQIRVHLQYLGYPITDDPLYNSTIWGPSKGKGACYGLPVEEVIAGLLESRNADKYLATDDDKKPKCYSETERLHENVPCPPTSLPTFSDSLPQEVRQRLIASYDPTCFECSRRYRDPVSTNLVLNLHCFRYIGNDWSYTAPLPDWSTSLSTVSQNELYILINDAIRSMD